MAKKEKTVKAKEEPKIKETKKESSNEELKEEPVVLYAILGAEESNEVKLKDNRYSPLRVSKKVQLRCPDCGEAGGDVELSDLEQKVFVCISCSCRYKVKVG